jgi:hypothetical protein
MEDIKDQLKVIYQVLADPELGESIAKMYKNLFDSLVKQGFTEGQAMEIVGRFSLQK